MNYALQIQDHNVKAHLDIEEEVKSRKDGVFTFTIRVNNGNIVDLNVTDYVNVIKKYGIVKAIVLEQITITESRAPFNH